MSNKILEAEQLAGEAMQAKNREIIRLERVILDGAREQIEDYNAMRNEIRAGMFSGPASHPERCWNDAANATLDIVKRYAKGEGINQMTRRMPKGGEA